MGAGDYASVSEYLFSLKAHGPKFGIDRMRVLAAALGHPERRTPCLHVAGTNGKGSVAAMLDAILRAAGWNVGLYTSPHLVHAGERVQVNRRPLTDEELAAYVAELQPIGDRIAAVNPDDRPSFFELMTAMAFLQFARKGCDIAVIETGLGGRLDATNVVAPEMAVITSIGLDHCELLGDTLEQIAREKAGIIKPGVPVVLGRMSADAETAIRSRALEVGAPVTSVRQRYGDDIESLPRTNLEGTYQRWNAATATVAAELLAARWRVTPDAIGYGLRQVHWPARWQRVTAGTRRLILDATHNQEGAAALDANLRALVDDTGRAPIVVTAVLGLDRAKALLPVMARHAREIRVVVLDDPRACGLEAIRRLAPPEFNRRIQQDTLERMFPRPGECAIGTEGDVIVVTGSIYLAGAVMARLGIASPNVSRNS